MLRKTLTLALIAIISMNSCKKDDTTTPEPSNPQIVVPSTYEFTDADGNSTVSFNGQAQRLEMLEEMVDYMKTVNTSGTTVDAQILKDMYANNGITWVDEPALGMTGSTLELKNKTLELWSEGSVFQSNFELLMESLASQSSNTESGNNSGGPGVAGVVVSSSDPTKEYLQNADGKEHIQFIEKGLMGTVFYNQITENHLGEIEMNTDNSEAIDPDNDKFYTEMEHAWDMAYGYFTTAIDYEPSGSGADRFWGKYVDGSRELYLGSATKISNAFRMGRAAITMNNLTVRDEQIAIIRIELEKAAAGTAIHYLNGAMSDFGDDALRNHQLSEATAFLNNIKYGYEPIFSSQEIGLWIYTLGYDYYEVTISNILLVRDEIADGAGLSEYKEVL